MIFGEVRMVIIVFVAEVSSHSVVAEIDWPSILGILLNAYKRNFIMHVSSRATLLDEYQSSTPSHQDQER